MVDFINLKQPPICKSKGYNCDCDYCFSLPYRDKISGFIKSSLISATTDNKKLRLITMHNKETITRDQLQRHHNWVMWKRSPIITLQ